MNEENLHLRFLQMALDEARKCTPTPTAFCVGCVLVVRLPGLVSEAVPTVLSTGYSRELPGNTHAEANALENARRLSSLQIAGMFPGKASTSTTIDGILEHVDVYTTLEPCSIRTSGLAPCADALIEAKVKRCFIGVGEPDDFVKCEGAMKLRDAGVEVVWIKGLEKECLDVARTGHHHSEV